jgi:hypothetical protein
VKAETVREGGGLLGRVRALFHHADRDLAGEYERREDPRPSPTRRPPWPSSSRLGGHAGDPVDSVVMETPVPPPRPGDPPTIPGPAPPTVPPPQPDPGPLPRPDPGPLPDPLPGRTPHPGGEPVTPEVEPPGPSTVPEPLPV